MEGCMNGMCASSKSLEWKQGWPLRSGGFATLCHNCGTAYEQLAFCEMFHSEETGWRECNSCGKRLHCGCIASSSSLELLDTGGVNCKNCSKSSKLLPYVSTFLALRDFSFSSRDILCFVQSLMQTPSKEKQKTCGLSRENGLDLNFEKMAPALSGDDAENDQLSTSHYIDTTPRKQEDFGGSGEMGYKLFGFNQSTMGHAKSYDMLQESKIAKTCVHKPLVQTNLSISLSASSNSNTLSGVIAEERQSSPAISSFQHGCRPLHLLPRLPNSTLSSGLETNSSSIRVARPPVEGRVKNQLLPRYWPRITDQELQQISGDSNSTIVPLFEKVLSASDAGRIGRLVLPKACAEAYFPPISQPEGLPLRIQDVKGKEWVFQFRFWPNNNSRMYVLEGVTPCIQSMQLQAGDTVTFSRMDPEGKLLMGFRKASLQKDSHYSTTGSSFQGEPLLGNAESLPIMRGYPGLLQSLKGSRNSSITDFPKHVYAGPHFIEEKNASKSGHNLLLPLPDRKRRNIGGKSKRLLIDGQDSLELRLSWEEVQDLLRPPSTVEPTTISIEDHEFEEFEEPPVFGKRSIFTVRSSGEQEQWTQCDSCVKWRKVPVDILLPPKWTCQDNVNDQTRCSCSAPDELDSRELENLLRMNDDFSERRVTPSLKTMGENASEPPNNGAPVEGDMSEAGGSLSVAATTKHPRHRPGCSCIVCIQPPSGKGKHKPTCVCNVCMTVKRRFKTLMMRKKKRQSEREAEVAQRSHFAAKEEAEVDSSVPHQELVNAKGSEAEIIVRCHSNSQFQEKINGGLDLNCRPAAPPRISMMSLVQEATLPLEAYLRQNGLTSLVNTEQNVTSPPDSPGENMVPTQEPEEGNDSLSEKDQRENDTS